MATITRAEIVGTRMAEEGSGGYTVNSTSYSVLIFYSNGAVDLVEGNARQIRPYLPFITPSNDMRQLKTLLDDFETKMKKDFQEAVQQAMFRIESNRYPIPDIIGKNRAEARKILEESGFVCDEQGQVDKDIIGTVTGYDRDPENFKVVTLKINYQYPDVRNMDSHIAVDIMRKAGFKPVIKKVETKDHSQINKVKQVLPGEGSYVVLYVADVQNNLFTEQIRGETSMMTIWKKWENFELKDKFPKTNAYILKYKDMERLYGKSNNFNQIKADLSKLIDEESGFR